MDESGMMQKLASKWITQDIMDVQDSCQALSTNSVSMDTLSSIFIFFAGACPVCFVILCVEVVVKNMK